MKPGSKLPRAPPVPKGGPPPAPPVSSGPDPYKEIVAQLEKEAEATRDPAEKRKEELLADPEFKKFPRLLKMGVPLKNIML